MAVTTVSEEPAATARYTTGVRSYTRTFLVIVDSKTDGPATVLADTRLPQDGSRHPEDFGAWLVQREASQAEGWSGWRVTCSYDTTRELGENPLFEPAAIDWDGENYEEYAVYDNAGDAILNSAGDPFENIMRERTRRVVTVHKNVASVPSWILDSEDAVNIAAFLLDGLLIPTGKARLAAPRISRWQNRNGIWFRELVMVIKLNRDGWDLQPLDAGYRYRNASNELVRITSDDGTDVTRPVPLDGSGDVLSDPTPSTAVYGSFDVYPAFDFNALPLV